MQTKGLTNDTTQTVPLHRAAGDFRRHSQTEPRTAHVVPTRSHRKKSVPQAPASRIQGLEVLLAAQPPFGWKCETLAIPAAFSQALELKE